MLKYIFKRILSSIVVLLGVVTITFFIARVIPSNPEVKWAGQRATPFLGAALGRDGLRRFERMVA